MQDTQQATARSRFPGVFWLVIVFEFFERGSYYGMMSVLSVYFTDALLFPKESVGVIKSVIQPILYFLPIVAGALADRFGYRRALSVAFALLGTGYFLTSRFTAYTPVFLSLVVMALGAGTFKPVISGTIARTTDKTNSTLGFGIYYWSINLGAFLFPLILVPYLKQIGWSWVIVASAVGTGAMLIPTLLFFREPARAEPAAPGRGTGLVQTIANAFEIVYSPFVLAHLALRGRRAGMRPLVLALLLGVCAFGVFRYVGQGEAARRPFFWLFLGLLFASALLILALGPRVAALSAAPRAAALLGAGGMMLLLLAILPGLSLFARILCSVIYLTLLSLFLIRIDDEARFRDHLRFLVMIFLYSGFWVLYFQMFDSVLWYVKAYVDAGPLDGFVNGILSALGISARWRFDVEHVTVINAGTIIALQLLVSRIVEKTRALPTMIFGILLGTIGMAILAISTHIWVFMAGIIVFSIGEMTAHPKFISYVGQSAPRDRVALYMGYIFLYGVIGSSIGGILGAHLYVRFVDELQQPRTLWLIFASIGVATILGLLLYDRFLGREERAA